MTDPALTDQQAITALRLVLDQQRRLPDPARLDELDAQLREAAGQPLADESVLAGASQGTATDGALARDTLGYLATQRPDLAGVIERASAMAADPLGAQSRFDPVTVGARVLVLLILQTDVQLERGSNGKWRFKLHKKAMSDSALGKLISKVIASYTS